MDLAHIFDKISNQMNDRLANIRETYKDSSDLRGKHSEAIFHRFLEEYLPKKLCISSGTIIDSEGRQSRQLDTIIFDCSKAPVLLQEGNIRTLPVECVYSVIEVKANLDIRAARKCFVNMKSVRQLQKKAYHKMGIIEHTYNLYGQSHLIPPVTYYVFAFDSIALGDIRDYIDSMHIQEQLPVCVLNKGVIYNHLKNDTYDALPQPGSELVSHATKKPLLLFYTLIMHYLCQSDMPNFNFNEYLGKAFLF